MSVPLWAVRAGLVGGTHRGVALHARVVGTDRDDGHHHPAGRAGGGPRHVQAGGRGGRGRPRDPQRVGASVGRRGAAHQRGVRCRARHCQQARHPAELWHRPRCALWQRRREGARRGGLRGDRRRAARQPNIDRTTPGRPGALEARRAGIGSDAEDSGRQHPQPAERRRRYPARCARCRDRRGRVREELAHRWFGIQARRGRHGRPGSDPRLSTKSPR